MTTKKNIYKTLIASLLLAVLGGCVDSGHFTVKGVVAGAGDQILYFENIGMSGVVTLDSLKLNSGGKFRFRQPRPQYPDFYRLKLKSDHIYFAIDSTETVNFTADVYNFATAYTVEGSESSKAFKEITLAQFDANQELSKLRASYGMSLIPDTTYQASITKAIDAYKEIAKKYVYGAPMSSAAYFALFQQIDGLPSFKRNDPTDSKAYGAVATSYNVYYPESPRAKQLVLLALESQKLVRGERSPQIDLSKVKEISYFDIELPDINGKNVKLSDIVAQGKAVLISFTAYQTEWSATFNMTLNQMYEKYRDKGFEIYQVSLDDDVHFWRNAAFNIPWTSVHDPQSTHSSIAATYNVRQLPALYLINSKGELVKRIESADTIEADIKSAL